MCPQSPIRICRLNSKALNRPLTTRTGFRFFIRGAGPEDETAIEELFSHITRDDLRFRFLASMTDIGSQEIDLLTHPDHDHTESFLAFTQDGSTTIASGMLACDESFDRGEVAMAIRPISSARELAGNSSPTSRASPNPRA